MAIKQVERGRSMGCGDLAGLQVLRHGWAAVQGSQGLLYTEKRWVLPPGVSSGRGRFSTAGIRSIPVV
jgi:hypothetical protein